MFCYMGIKMAIHRATEELQLLQALINLATEEGATVEVIRALQEDYRRQKLRATKLLHHPNSEM
jgi:hypothetical protein